MSIREMLSLAKSNLKVAGGNAFSPPTALPQGRPARATKPVELLSKDQVSGVFVSSVAMATQVCLL
jgi:hypothetical protein